MSSDQTPPKIIIVDDQPLNLRLASTVLKAKGYEIECIADSSEAIKTISRFLPDLILLDIMMPDIDGITLCKTLKENPLTQDIPVLFITAKTGPESLSQAFNAGGVDFVTKPFQTEELLARVQAHAKVQLLQKKLRETINSLETKHRELLSSQKQVQQLQEAVLKICAWTKQIEIDGKWIPIEEYFSTHLGIKLTHGVSEEAAKEILKNL